MYVCLLYQENYLGYVCLLYQESLGNFVFDVVYCRRKNSGYSGQNR